MPLTFSAVIPDVGQATSLLGQLSSAVEGVIGDKKNSLPTAQIAQALETFATLKIDSPAALVQSGVSQLAKIDQIFPQDTEKLLQAFVGGLDDLSRFIEKNPFVEIVGATGQLEQTIQTVLGQMRVLSDKFKSIVSDRSHGPDLSSIMSTVAGVMTSLKPLWGGGSGPGYADQVLDFFKTRIEGLGRWVTVPSAINGVVYNLRRAEQITGSYSLAQLCDDFRAQLATVKVSIAAIDFANAGTVETVRLQLAALVRAQDTLRRALAGFVDKVGTPLLAADTSPFATALGDFVRGLEAVTSSTAGQLDMDLDIADVIHRLSEVLCGVDFAKYATDVKGFLQHIDASIDEIDPSVITVPMAGQIEKVTGYLNKLETAKVAITLEIRKLFESVRQQIEATNLVGVRKQIEDTLKSISQTVKGQIQTALAAIQTALGDVLAQIQAAAQALGQLIDPQIKQGLAGVLTTLLSGLQAIDLPGLLKSAQEQLQSTCEQLKAIDFSAVVDPVIADIQELTGKLQKIDISLLDGMLKISLEGAVQVIKGVNFKADISDALVSELEDVINTNLQGFAGIQEKVEAGLGQIRMLKPDALLASADAPFEALLGALAGLQPSQLLKPLVDAAAALKTLLASISPAKLLAPLTQPLADLTAKLDAFAPSALLAPLQQKVNDALAVLDVLDLDPILDDLKARIASLLSGIGGSPISSALAGGLNVNEKMANSVLAKLDTQKLQAMIEKRLIGPLNTLLGSLDANRLLPIFQSLQRRIEVLSPTAVLHQPRQCLDTVKATLDGLHLSDRITSLQMDCQSIHGSLTVLHPSPSDAAAHTTLVSLSAELRPIDAFSGAAAKVDAMKAAAVDKLTQLDQAITAHSAPLQSIYTALTRLIPGFAQASSPQEAANALAAEATLLVPEAISTEISAIIDKLKGLVQELNLGEMMTTASNLSNRAQQKILALQDLNALFAPVQGQLDAFKAKVRGIADLSPLTAELDGVFNAVKAQLDALNPASWLASIDTLYQDVCSAIDALPIGSMGTQLDQIYTDNIVMPIGNLKPSVSLKPALDAAFAPVAAILEQISVDDVFAAFQDLIDSLCDQLRSELGKVETAFGQMLSAVPV